MMINGAGATFPYPIYSKWFDDYAKVDPPCDSTINRSVRRRAKQILAQQSISALRMGR